MVTNEALCTGIFITAMKFLTILAVMTTKKYLYTRRKVIKINKVSSANLQTELYIMQSEGCVVFTTQCATKQMTNPL